MSVRGARTIICFGVSSTGLVTIAASLLTHHPLAAKIGAGVALAGALLIFTGPADARALTASDLKRIEAINQARNRQVYADRWRGDFGPCTIYAVNKAVDLAQAGYGPDEVSIAIVQDEHAHLHAVAEIKGDLKGRPVTIVLDSRLAWTAERKDLEAIGYSWTGLEFTRAEASNHPSEDSTR